MNYAQTYATVGSSRAPFITKTYLHVIAGLLAFVGLEYALFSSGIAQSLAAPLANNWLLVLGAMVLVSFLTAKFAAPGMSRVGQYVLLGLFIVLEAFIFIPLLALGLVFGGSELLSQAALLTVAMVTALSLVVFIFRTNYSFLRPLLLFGGIAAVGLIVLSFVFGFELGLLFTYAMIVYAGGSILYETSNILHDYGDNDYVLAALGLLTSILLLFYYLLQALLANQD